MGRERSVIRVVVRRATTWANRSVISYKTENTEAFKGTEQSLTYRKISIALKGKAWNAVETSIKFHHKCTSWKCFNCASSTKTHSSKSMIMWNRLSLIQNNLFSITTTKLLIFHVLSRKWTKSEKSFGILLLTWAVIIVSLTQLYRTTKLNWNTRSQLKCCFFEGRI